MNTVDTRVENAPVLGCSHATLGTRPCTAHAPSRARPTSGGAALAFDAQDD